MEKGEIDFMLQNLVDFYFYFTFFSPKLIEASAKKMAA